MNSELSPPLSAPYRKINRLANIAANAIYISSGCQIFQVYLLVACRCDKISVGIEQFEMYRLITLILIYLRIEQRTPQLKSNLDKGLARSLAAVSMLPKLASGSCRPTPRKDNATSARRNAGNISVACVSSGREMFGRI